MLAQSETYLIFTFLTSILIWISIDNSNMPLESGIYSIMAVSLTASIAGLVLGYMLKRYFGNEEVMIRKCLNFKEMVLKPIISHIIALFGLIMAIIEIMPYLQK